VFFETEPETLPPFFSMRGLKWSRSWGRVPVMTKVLPVKAS
jgi:hypothetical protein